MNNMDITRKMLNIIREKQTLYENRKMENNGLSRVLKEEETRPEDDEVTNINDVDVRIISDDENFQISEQQREELSGIIDSFREQVSQIANLSPGLTLKQKQIRLDGEFSDYQLKFAYIAGEDSGMYISSDMSEMDDELFDFLDKGKRFFLTFRDAVEPLIRLRD